MEMTQALIATTTLGSHISIGEWLGHETHAKPGNYNVYKVWGADDYDYTILFVHESETQHINNLHEQLDVDDVCGVDFASYGIQTLEPGSKWSLENWQKQRKQTSDVYTDGYVTDTNCGDGSFMLYTNENHSVFMLDDEDVYLDGLLAEHGITEFDWLSSFGVEDDTVYVAYYPDEYSVERTEVHVEPGQRRVDTLVQLMVHIYNEELESGRNSALTDSDLNFGEELSR